MISLPIDAVVPALRQALGAQHQAVLEAPPGAGKTTRVPLALLDEPWLAGQRILMLEPRRLAARAAAERLAAELGEKVGETVGYRIRLESRVGPKTRIEVVTEGILARRLQDDPALDGVGLVIFDEFHERSLDADLALALTLNGRELLRDEPPLKVLVMSATLEGERLAALLGEAPVVRSEGRMFPVDIRWGRAAQPGEFIEPRVQQAVLQALAEETLEVPSGSRIRLDYSETPPILAVRLQELFGLGDTPRIAQGRLAVKLHLLSPAHRPVQVTQDLANFWRSTYAEVRKDLKGRYPKHYWPDDPLVAEATARAKPRK
ncbi:TPA: DEAD/DEAH box helicase [Pseudomonas aeruginosa]|nr:DEAD/DEAH box helicase [Pseudomonas aeruginosa]